MGPVAMLHVACLSLAQRPVLQKWPSVRLTMPPGLPLLLWKTHILSQHLLCGFRQLLKCLNARKTHVLSQHLLCGFGQFLKYLNAQSLSGNGLVVCIWVIHLSGPFSKLSSDEDGPSAVCLAEVAPSPAFPVSVASGQLCPGREAPFCSFPHRIGLAVLAQLLLPVNCGINLSGSLQSY